MDKILEDRAEILAILLRTEYDIIECYKTAMTFRQSRPAASLLRSICDEHCQAAEILRVLLDEAQPDDFLETTLSFSRFDQSFADPLTPFTALSVLEERERETVEDYFQATRDESLGEECVEVISYHLLPQSRTHLREIERLAAHSKQLEAEYA
ncbi:MAG: hypothetical protein K8T89_05380 [Planctomycetes bacterium]|nr:hypothetical protein [Planctomycetota bacterium]